MHTLNVPREELYSIHPTSDRVKAEECRGQAYSTVILSILPRS
jgi:hypothetical protein